MTTCIHRLSKRIGAKCGDTAVHDTLFCASHRRVPNTKFYEDMDAFMNDQDVVTAGNLFECLGALWTHLNSSPTSLNDAFVAVDILTYLCDHVQIAIIGNALSIPVRKQKMAASFDIINIMWNVWHIGKDKKKVGAIKAMQAKWRNRTLESLRGPYPSICATNDTDPFTLEALDTLDPENIFSYWEAIGSSSRLYAFNGKDFYEYVYIHYNDTNPLTRVPIPIGVQSRLKQWYARANPMDCASEESTTDREEEWATPSIAFTDVSTELEARHGIVVQPQWFMDMTSTDIENIVRQYYRLVTHIAPNDYMHRYSSVFDQDLEIIQYEFARSMYSMVCEEVAPSFYVCCLAVSISNHCTPLYSSLPDWVFDAAEV
jgi:hypothetical protein